MPCVRWGDRTRLHPFPTIAEPLLNRRATRKQIKVTTCVANLGLGIRMKVTMLVLREVTAAILMTHETSSTPNVTVDLFPGLQPEHKLHRVSDWFQPSEHVEPKEV